MGGAARALTGACAALALALAAGDDAAGADCPDVKSLLRATQTQASVAQVTMVVRMTLASLDDEGQIPTAEMEQLHDAGIDAYSPVELTRDMQAALESNCNATAVASTLAFFRSPAGVKLIRGSLELSPHSSPKGGDEYFEKLREEGLSSGRLEAVRSVRPASLAFELPPRAEVSLMRAIATETARALAKAQDVPMPSDAEIADVIGRLAGATDPYLELWNDLSLLFATRDLSVAELQEVRSFLGSSAGVWYRDALARAFERAIEQAGQRFTAAAAAPRTPELDLEP